MDPALLIIIGSVVGALVVAGLAIVWLRPKPHKTAASTDHGSPTIAAPQMTQETLDRLQQQTVQRYQQTIEAAAARFDADLSHTSTQLGEQVSRMTTDVISQE